MGWASAALPNRPYLPVPLSCSICVPTASLMFKVAVRAPVAVGLKVAVIVQSQPALRLDPQLDVSLKSPGAVPLSVMLVIASIVSSAPSLSRSSADRAGLSQHPSATLVHGKLCRAVRCPARRSDGNRHRTRGQSRWHYRRYLRVRHHCECGRFDGAKFHCSRLNQPGAVDRNQGCRWTARRREARNLRLHLIRLRTGQRSRARGHRNWARVCSFGNDSREVGSARERHRCRRHAPKLHHRCAAEALAKHAYLRTHVARPLGRLQIYKRYIARGHAEERALAAIEGATTTAGRPIHQPVRILNQRRVELAAVAVVDRHQKCCEYVG